MDIKIIKDFIKDIFGITMVYFINTFFIILFFYLYTNGQVSLWYPLEISFFIFVIFIVCRFYKFANFNKSINMIVKNPKYTLKTYTTQQKKIDKVICKIHRYYISEINSIYKEIDDKNKLFSQWVHNLKTPVSVIDLIIQETRENKKIGIKILDELEEENNRILNNLEQLLNMIRIDDFSKDYIPETLNLYNSIKNVINKKKSEFIYNKVFPKLNCSNKDIKVLSDAKWNEFIINQIISNAIKYSRETNEGKNCNSTKYIYFDIKMSDKYTILEIKDEGIGIPEYDLHRVFEPFFTGENGRMIKNSTGIGLYVCKVAAERLGQNISINSKKGEGTIVKIKYLSKL